MLSMCGWQRVRPCVRVRVSVGVGVRIGASVRVTGLEGYRARARARATPNLADDLEGARHDVGALHRDGHLVGLGLGLGSLGSLGLG